MIKATPEQHQQIEEFFEIIHEMHDDLLLYPCVDKKTNVTRLAICVADRDNDIIYVKGLYFLPGDSLYERFQLVEPDSDVLTEKPAGAIRRILRRIKNFWQTWKL